MKGLTNLQNKPSKVAATKRFFSSVYITDTTCLDEYLVKRDK